MSAGLAPLKKHGRIQWPTPSPPLPAFDRDASGEMLFYVYYLICPVTHRVRYIGCTCCPHYRWRSHYGAPKSRTRPWIEWLVDRELLPLMQIVAGPLSASEAFAEECRRIVAAKSEGWDGLLNRNNG